MKYLAAYALALGSGCFEHHVLSAPLTAPDAGTLADAQPSEPRVPHPCVDAPVEVAELDPEALGRVNVVSRGEDYAVTWSFGSSGMAVLMHDGRRIAASAAAVEVISLEGGFLVTPTYSDTFQRSSTLGEPFGAPLVLPEIVPPHWQFLERHGDRVRVVSHSPFDAQPHFHEIDLGTWSARSMSLVSPQVPGSRWAFSADGALIEYGRDGGRWLQGQRVGPDEVPAVVFDVPSPFPSTDMRFDEASNGWWLAGSVQGEGGDDLAASARVSVDGELTDLAVLPSDAGGSAASIWATNGAHIAIATSPIGPAFAIMPTYFGRDSRAPVTVAYPNGETLRGGGVFGVASSFQPAITWSDADDGFAIVSVEEDDAGRTFLALRCGLRP